MGITPQTARDLRNKFPVAIRELEEELGLNINLHEGARTTGKNIIVQLRVTPKKISQSKILNMDIIEGNRTEQVLFLIGKGITRSRDMAKALGTNTNYINRLIRIAKTKGLLILITAFALSSCKLFLPAIENPQKVVKVSSDTIQMIKYPNCNCIEDDTIQLLTYFNDKRAWSILHKPTGVIEWNYNYKMDGTTWIRDTTKYRTIYATNGLYKVEFKRDSLWYILGK